MKKALKQILTAVILCLAALSCGKENISEKQEEKEEETEDVLSFYVDNKQQFIEIGKKTTIRVLLEKNGKRSDYPYDSDPLGISFRSDNPDILTVTGKGVASALRNGKASVLVESKVVDKSYSISFSVSGDPEQEKFLNAPWNWVTTKDGITRGYAQFDLLQKNEKEKQSISIVKYPESKFVTAIDYRTGDDCTTVDVVGKELNAVAAINGSFFNTTKWYSVTTMLWNGEIVSMSSGDEAKNRSTGVIGLTKENVMEIFPYDGEVPSSWNRKYSVCMASGPLLIYNGKVQNFISRDYNNNRHPRSMLGITEDRTIVMMAVDGRITGQSTGLTIPELAKLAGWLELKYAIAMDSGGSVTLWTRDTGIMNYPCDNRQWDHTGPRRIPTVIYIKKKI